MIPSNLVIFEQLGSLELKGWSDEVLLDAERDRLKVNRFQHLKASQLYSRNEIQLFIILNNWIGTMKINCCN